MWTLCALFLLLFPSADTCRIQLCSIYSTHRVDRRLAGASPAPHQSLCNQVTVLHLRLLLYLIIVWYMLATEEQEAAMATVKPILYNAWISSCSHRIRIVLNLKGVEYEYKSVNPRTDPDYEKINPIKYIPALVDGDFVVSDSLAIALYLEDKYPQHPLLPKDIKTKAITLQIANIVCSSIQPLQGYGVIGHEGRLSSDESLEVVRRYINKGFSAIEKLLEGCESKYATGDDVQLGDVFLEPQIHAAINRFQVDMSKYPVLSRLHDAYMEIPAFQAALPKNQPDAPSP